MFQLLIFLLSGAQWSSATTTPDVPATIEIDVTSPVSNYNYPQHSPFPISFAIKNAYLAFDFGFTLDFTITGTQSLSDGLNETGMADGGSFNSYNISANSSTFIWNPDMPYTIPPGAWMLAWTYGFVSCVHSGSTTHIENNEVSSSVNFAVTENGTLPTANGCSGGLFYVASTYGGCPDVRNSPNNATACTSTSSSNSSSSSKSSKSKEAVTCVLMSFMAVAASVML
jgi:hypothetical protein